MDVYERQEELGSVVDVKPRTRRGKKWSASISHVLFLKSDWWGFSLKGLLCIPQKGALSEMDTWLTEHFAFAFLPSQPPVPSFSPPVLL